MASHIEIGKAGEKLAEAYLVKNGYTILHRNWRCGREEVDIIALKENLLHFVEVKYRSTDYRILPEEAVNRKKVQTLLRAVNQFLDQFPNYIDFRLDILSITERPNQPTEYCFIEDVTL